VDFGKNNVNIKGINYDWYKATYYLYLSNDKENPYHVNKDTKSGIQVKVIERSSKAVIWGDAAFKEEIDKPPDIGHLSMDDKVIKYASDQ
jgi:hypothetical protein